MRARQRRVALARPDPEGEGLQDVGLHGGGQQHDGGLGAVLVPVDVEAVTLEQFEGALVGKHLHARRVWAGPGPEWSCRGGRGATW